MRARHLAVTLAALGLGAGVSACGGTKVSEQVPTALPEITVSEADATGLSGAAPGMASAPPSGDCARETQPRRHRVPPG